MEKNISDIMVVSIFSFAAFIGFSVIFIIFYKLSKGGTHLPKVNVVFPISDSSVKLDSDKCTYKMKKIRGEDVENVKGNALPVRGVEGTWQITIPEDVSSNEDTIELTLVEESDITWKIGSFYPHVTQQTATTEGDIQ